MRKYAAIIIMVLLLLSGCSYDFGASEKMVDKLGDLVDKRNSLQSFGGNLEDSSLNMAVNSLEMSMQNGGVPSQTAVNDVLDKLKKAKASREDKKKKTEEIMQDVTALKSQLNDLSDENKTLAENAINDYIALLSEEEKMYAGGIQMDDEDLVYYQAIGLGQTPPKDNYNQLAAEQKQFKTSTDQLLNKFNTSWNTFHKEVKGMDTVKSKY